MGDNTGEDMLAIPVWDFKPETQTAETSGQEANKSSESMKTPDSQKETPTAEANPKETPKKEETPKKQEEEARQPSEPPTRGKNKYDFIIERKQRQLEKMKQEKLAQLDKEITENGGDPATDSTVDPSDEETITKVIDKKAWAQLEYIERLRFEQEVNAQISENKLAKYITSQDRETIKAYAAHPAWANVPINEIVISVLWAERLMKIGAEEQRESDLKKAASKVGGDVGKKTEGSQPDYASMTDAEFEAAQNRVRMGL